MINNIDLRVMIHDRLYFNYFFELLIIFEFRIIPGVKTGTISTKTFFTLT